MLHGHGGAQALQCRWPYGALLPDAGTVRACVLAWCSMSHVENDDVNADLDGLMIVTRRSFPVLFVFVVDAVQRR
jgi:hypothetical protein